MIQGLSRAGRGLATLLPFMLLAAACGDGPSGPAPVTALMVNISGLPAGTPASVTVTGPSNFRRDLTATTTLPNLQPGSYTVTAAEVNADGHVFQAPQATQTVDVATAQTPATATVGYVQASGSLNITLTGLPAGAAAEVSVSGPGGNFTATGSTLLHGLAAGTYIVTAAEVVADGSSFGSSPETQYVTVTAGGQTSLSITYALRELNFFIAGVHLSQSIQRHDMSIPFIAGRDGYVRVFGRANIDNTNEVGVRVRFFRGGVAVDSLDMGDVFGVPVDVDETSWTRSWNAPVPGYLFQPGTSIQAEIDPENRTGERDETDNMYPFSGDPLALEVVEVAPLGIRLVPVIQSSGAMANVTHANMHAFMSDLMSMYPLSGYEADIRAPYTTSSTAQSGGGNWSNILSEIRALRVADADPRYYYGLLNLDYTGGTMGIGYVPGHAALGTDGLPYAAQVLAHELGHNWGRLHAPCGSVSGVDPSYPYPGGITGVSGIDVTAGRPIPPDATDLMGYCANVWISDYTYLAVLNYRAGEAQATVATSATRESILLWGRMNADEFVLEPAFAVNTRPQLPVRDGRYTLAGLDAAGRELFRISFDPERVNEHAQQPESHFAFAVPMSESARRQLTSIRLSGEGREVVQRVAGGAAPAAPVRMEAAGNHRTLVQWDARAYPVVMLRDARTGETVAFARGGSAVVPLAAADVQAIASDGVRSTVFGAATLPER